MLQLNQLAIDGAKDSLRTVDRDSVANLLDILDNLTQESCDISVSGAVITISASEIQRLESDGSYSTQSREKSGVGPISNKYASIVSSTLNVSTGAVTGDFVASPAGIATTTNYYVGFALELRSDAKWYIVWGTPVAAKVDALNSTNTPNFSTTSVLKRSVGILQKGGAGDWNFNNPAITDFIMLPIGGAGGSGSGASSDNITNYLDFLDFSVGIDGFDSESHSGSFDATYETTNPGSDSGSLKLSKASGDQSGKYVQTDVFTVEDIHAPSVLRLSIPIFNCSVNYEDGDAGIVLYDVENGVEIFPAVEDIFATNNNIYVYSFQIPAKGGGANEGQFRLRIKVKSTNTSVWNITIPQEGLFFGYKPISRGPILTEWEEFTPNMSWSTNVSVGIAYKRRNGNMLEVIKGRITLSGTPNNTNLTTTLPNSLNIDSNLADVTVLEGLFGQVGGRDATDQRFSGRVLGNNNYTTLRLAIIDTASVVTDSVVQIGQSAPFSWANGDSITFNYSVPIAGWASNANMSEDFGNKDISLRYSGNGGTSLTANTTDIDWTTKEEDNCGCWDGTTFMASETADYLFIGQVQFTTSDNYGINLYIDGSQDHRAGCRPTSYTQPICTIKHLKFGQQVTFRCEGSLTLNNSPTSHWLTVKKLSSPQTLFESNKVRAIYHAGTDAQSVSNGTRIQFNYKLEDTHNSVTTGSSWVFTSKKNTTYMVRGYTITQSVTPSSVTSKYAMRGTGSLTNDNPAALFSPIDFADQNTNAKQFSADFMAIIKMNIEDTFALNFSAAALTVNLAGGANTNRIEIIEV